jgi:hypothetical protein
MAQWSGIWQSNWNSIWGPIWGGGAVGPLCGYSTYWNGTEEEKVDFVKRAPCIMLEDYFMTPDLPVAVNINDGVQDFHVGVAIKINQANDNFDYLIDLNVPDSSQFAVIYQQSTDKWQFFVKDFDGSNSANVVATNTVGNKSGDFFVGIDYVAQVAYMEWDGVRDEIDISSFGAINVDAFEGTYVRSKQYIFLCKPLG